MALLAGGRAGVDVSRSIHRRDASRRYAAASRSARKSTAPFTRAVTRGRARYPSSGRHRHARGARRDVPSRDAASSDGSGRSGRSSTTPCSGGLRSPTLRRGQAFASRPLRRRPLPAAGRRAPRRAGRPAVPGLSRRPSWSSSRYVFGDELGPYQGRIRAPRELELMAREHGEFRVYVVEVCRRCSWNYLTTTFLLGDGQPRPPLRASPRRPRPLTGPERPRATDPVRRAVRSSAGRGTARLRRSVTLGEPNARTGCGLALHRRSSRGRVRIDYPRRGRTGCASLRPVVASVARPACPRGRRRGRRLHRALPDDRRARSRTSWPPRRRRSSTTTTARSVIGRFAEVNREIVTLDDIPDARRAGRPGRRGPRLLRERGDLAGGHRARVLEQHPRR